MAIALAAVALAPAATPNLSSVILQPAQVGKGFVTMTEPNGKLVKGQVTLNLCGTGYGSEQLRTSRYQLDYLKQDVPVGISNEVVTYRPGGAAEAMNEVTRRAATCPHGPVATGSTTVPKVTFRITRIVDARLLPGSLAVRVDVSFTLKGKHVAQTSYAVYQRQGNVLSGVYSFGGDSAEQRTLCLHAAEASAGNLRRGSSSVRPEPTA